MKVIKIKAEKLRGIGVIKGLLGKKTPRAVRFNTRWGIHTFGMKFAIDVIILDSKNQIKLIKESIAPNKILMWNPKYSSVIELPTGIVQSFEIEVGDFINYSN